MKRFRATLWLFCSVFIGIAPNFAQEQKQPVEKKDSVCPQIVNLSVTPDFPGDDKKLTFTVSIISPAGFTPELKWSVKGGKVIDGQGTNSLVVEVDSECPNPSATVEITNAPKECPSMASATLEISDCGRNQPIYFNSYEKISLKSEKSILDSLANSLRKYPYDTVYIVRYVGKRERLRDAENDLIRAMHYLTDVCKIADNRIFLAVGKYSQEQMTQLWLVPAGADFEMSHKDIESISAPELKAKVLQNKPQPKKKRRAKRGK